MSRRIALMNPTYWPEVRRGSERLIHDLAVSLQGRGHRVSILTTHPGPSEETVEEGVRVVRSRRPPSMPRAADQEYFLETAPVAALALMRGEYDVAQAFFPVDAWAAVQVNRRGGPPVAFSFHGIPARQYLVARRRRLGLVSTAAREAQAVSVLSEAAAEPYRRYLLRDPCVLPGGIFCSDFEVDVARANHPCLICTASLGDPRKGGRLLLDAFARARERVPGARLLLAGGRDPHMSKLSLELPKGVDLFDGDDTQELAAAYASAWASVLPATWEAFGLVLVESMAAGTPPIALRAGASPEVLTNGVGTLVEPDDVGALAESIASALAAPPDDEMSDACRRRAREFDWERVARQYEDFHLLAREGEDVAADATTPPGGQ
jgi:glycosyltransferase involved in cell wall biosynthesis